MILLAEKNVILQANISAVFEFVTNMENYIKWFPGVVDIRSANNLAHGTIGKQYIEILHLPQGSEELTIEVKESIKNKNFITEGNLESLLPKMEMLFSDQGNNDCQFYLSYYSRNPDLKEDDEIILALRKDLSERIEIGIKDLKTLVEN